MELGNVEAAKYMQVYDSRTEMLKPICLSLNPGSAIYKLCGLGKVALPLDISVSLSLKWEEL